MEGIDEDLPPDAPDGDLPCDLDEAEDASSIEDLGIPIGCRCSRQCHTLFSDSDLQSIQTTRSTLDKMTGTDRTLQVPCTPKNNQILLFTCEAAFLFVLHRIPECCAGVCSSAKVWADCVQPCRPSCLQKILFETNGYWSEKLGKTQKES